MTRGRLSRAMAELPRRELVLWGVKGKWGDCIPNRRQFVLTPSGTNIPAMLQEELEGCSGFRSDCILDHFLGDDQALLEEISDDL